MASTIRGIESYIENPHGYDHYWHKGTLFTTLDTALIRNIWTTVFVVLNLSIVLLGAFFLKSVNLCRLSTKSKKVRINHLTSWLSLTGVLRYLCSTRQFPGGYCGLLMLLTGVLSLAHQYFTNSFIQRATLQSACSFESGVVTTLVANDQPKGVVLPSSTFSSATTVYNAQHQVWLNGGAWGIYQKVNSNSTTFSPTNQDVIGGWNCSYYPDTTISRTDWQNESILNSSLQEQMFLFTEAYSIWGGVDTNGDGGVHGFLAWSANQPTDSGEEWNVRASVSTNLNGSAAPLYSTIRTVTNLECELVTTSNWTLPSMPSLYSLDEWGPKTYGFLMTAEPGQYATLIEWMLNAMVMVTGSGNYDQWKPTALPEGASTTYGCKVPGTKIMPEFWVILGAILFIFVILFLADIVLFFFRIKWRCWKVDYAHLADAAPSGVDDWQLALIIEVQTEVGTIKATEMKDYLYGWDESKEKYRIIAKNPKRCDQAQKTDFRSKASSSKVESSSSVEICPIDSSSV